MDNPPSANNTPPLNFAPFEVELEKICASLPKLSADVKDLAISYLTNMNPTEYHSPKMGEDPKFVVVAALFIAAQDRKNDVSLSDILQQANLR